jgi:hypothetical protein
MKCASLRSSGVTFIAVAGVAVTSARAHYSQRVWVDVNAAGQIYTLVGPPGNSPAPYYPSQFTPGVVYARDMGGSDISYTTLLGGPYATDGDFDDDGDNFQSDFPGYEVTPFPSRSLSGNFYMGFVREAQYYIAGPNGTAGHFLPVSTALGGRTNAYGEVLPTPYFSIDVNVPNPNGPGNIVESIVSPTSDATANPSLTVTAFTAGTHAHPGMTLHPNPLDDDYNGSATDYVTDQDEYDGVYAIALQLSAPGYATSSPFYLVLGKNAPVSEIATAGTSAANVGGLGPNPVYWADADGSWAKAANWAGGVAPGGASAVVIFGGTTPLTSGRTVTLDGARTAGVVAFNSPFSVTVNAGVGGSLIMDAGSIAALIYVGGGSHAINAPVTGTASGLLVSVAAGSTLTFGGALTTAALTTTGPGTIALAAPAIGNGHAVVLAATDLTVSQGSVVTVPYSDRAQGLQSRLIVANTLADAGVLDLTDNDMLLRSTSESAVNALIASGNLISSVAGQGAGDDRLAMLAVVTNSDGAGGALYATFDGVAAAPSDVLVRYTYGGDTDLNGYVDATDVANFLAGFNGHLTGWINGDFNGDGVIDGTDLGILMASLSGQGASFGSPGGGGGPSGGVPEPSSIGVMSLACLGLGRRRRV